MALSTKRRIPDVFAPWLDGETGTAYLSAITEGRGFNRAAMYNLEIMNNIIQNHEETQLYRRIPQEVLRGFAEGDRLNVQASLVARAGESPVGAQPQEGHGTQSPFETWDRQERQLEQWARREGCWHDNVPAYLEKSGLTEFDRGAEAKVYFADRRTTVIKALTVMFNPQETLDRIALTNFLTPQTGLKLRGMGRGEDGELMFILEQPFIQGTAMAEGYATIPAFDSFECVDEDSPNPFYATGKYLLGDIHDRNIIVTPEGRPQVIDCNLYLNTPERNMGGEWIIPEVEADMDKMQTLHSALSSLLPKSITEEELKKVLYTQPDRLDEYQAKGYCEGPVTLTKRDGATIDIVIQKDPAIPGRVLWNYRRNIQEMMSLSQDWNAKDAQMLAYGYGIEKDGKKYRFDLDRGRVIATGNKKLSLTINKKKERNKTLTYSPC